MDTEYVVFAMRGALQVLLIVLSGIMIPALLVGLLISVFQAATQIQEQLLTFLPKLMIIIGIIYFGFSYGMGLFVTYFQDVLYNIPNVIK